MRKAMLLVLGVITSIYTQALEPPVPGIITSDYGARNKPNTGEYDWHEGIDFDGYMWEPIEAVEGGNIVEIGYEEPQGAGWYIRIQGNLARWTYMHTFYDAPDRNPISPDKKYEAAKTYLVDPNTGQNNPSEPVYVFIFWTDRQNRRAQKVLSSYGKRWIRWGNDYILNSDGTQRIKTQGAVGDRDTIAPLGRSGMGYPTPGEEGTHVHVGANSPGQRYDINPLYYIDHSRANYQVSILMPQENEVLFHLPGEPQYNQIHERMQVRVNSQTGLDLDRIFVYLNNKLYAYLSYGGRPPGLSYASPFPDWIRYEGNRGNILFSGIDPQGNVPGIDDFYFIGGLSENGVQFNTKIHKTEFRDAYINYEAKFKDGRRTMLARAYNIRWWDSNANAWRDFYFDAQKQIILDNFAPYIDEVIVLQGGEVIYQGYWPVIPQSSTYLGELQIGTRGTGDAERLFEIAIFFSEEMNTDSTPKIRVKFMNSGRVDDLTILNSSWDALGELWTATVKFPQIQEEDAGEVYLMIGGVTDLAGNMLDSNPATIAFRNPAGGWSPYYERGDDEKHFFYIETPKEGPCVASHYPGNDTVDVNTPIIITFTREMNQPVTEQAIIIEPDFAKIFEWIDPQTVKITPQNPDVDLKYETRYTVTVTGDAEDIEGNKMDSTCAPYSFSFKTKSPEFELTVIPQTAKVPIGDTIFHNIKVFNKNPRTEVFELNFNVFQTSQILRYILPSQTQFEIPENGEVSTILKVYDPRDPEGCDYGNVPEFDYLGIKVTARVLNTQKEIFKNITDEPEKIDNAPTMTSTSPSDGEQNVKVNKDIKISFSKAMDTASVRSAISINPSVEIISYEWGLLRLLCLSGYCVYCVGV
jgi:hypothetical protein